MCKSVRNGPRRSDSCRPLLRNGTGFYEAMVMDQAHVNMHLENVNAADTLALRGECSGVFKLFTSVSILIVRANAMRR